MKDFDRDSIKANPWQTLTEELDQLSEAPLPKIRQQNIRRKPSAVEQWVNSFLKGSIPTYLVAFVAMALLCPPSEEPLGLFVSAWIALPLTWLFRPILFHGRRGSIVTFLVGGIYLGLLAGLSTLVGREVARTFVRPNFRYASAGEYAFWIQGKMETYLSPSYIGGLLALIFIFIWLAHRLKKKFVWLDQESPQAFLLVFCLLVTTVLPWTTMTYLVVNRDWTAREKAWLKQAQQQYESEYPAAAASSAKSSWTEFLLGVRERGFVAQKTLTPSEAQEYTSQVLKLWARSASLPPVDSRRLQRFVVSLIASSNPHPKKQDLIQIVMELQLNDLPIGEGGDHYRVHQSLTSALVPYLASASISEIEQDDWEKNLRTWIQESQFQLDKADAVVFAYLDPRAEQSASDPTRAGNTIRPLRVFGAELSPSPTQLLNRYQAKAVIASWLEVKRTYRELSPKEQLEKIHQQMASDGAWESVHSAIFFYAMNEDFNPTLELCQFIIQARTQHEASGTWPASRTGPGWNFDRTEHRVTMTSGPSVKTARPQSWVLE